MRTSTRRPTSDQVSERLQVAGDRARETAGVARERAGDLAETARERAGDLAESARPATDRARSTLSTVGRTALGVGVGVPALLSKLLGVLASLSGGLAERGREVADRIEPSTGARRRSRLHTVLWFLGGFGAGTAAGWVLHARAHHEPVPSDLGYETEGAPYGDEARVIDARRASADLS